MSLSWYIKRAQVMGWREWIHRFQEQADLYWLRACQKKRDKNPGEYIPFDFSFFQSKKPLLPDLDWDLSANRAYAEPLLAGYWPALGFDWCWQQHSDWHLAPDSGNHWPNDFFSTIEKTTDNPFGDIRVVWEPSRLQQLVSLALLAREGSNRAKAVDLFERLLLSWVDANPPYRGVHYVSAMECALRLLSVCHSVDMIRGYLTQPEVIARAVLRLVDSHASLIIQRLSLYSSAGNHTIAECVGLIYAGELFPELPGAARWREQGLSLLEQEAHRQFLPDGGSVEQAFAYHLLITDLCQLVVRLLAKKGRAGKSLVPIVESATEFLSLLFTDDWQLPNVGDGDGGYALSPYLCISHKQNNISNTSNMSNASKISETHKKWNTFFDTGYSLLRENKPHDRLILFDHGALGMAPCYGHGHSDCLSVYWRENDEPLLLDPGSFTYNADVQWRSYFRGVSAHNTVSVDRQNQAIERSAFMWSQPFEGRLIDVPATIDGHHVLLASHHGYQRLGVVHYRALIYGFQGETLVWDFLHPVGAEQTSHELSLWWQLGGQSLAASDGCYRVRGDSGACLQLEVLGGKVHCCCGDQHAPQGWNSPIYGKKYPITTLETRYCGQLPHEFHTYISPQSRTICHDQYAGFDTIIDKLRLYIL
jgi:Heparinase II/III-like protein/Heparinase II/III N-terminus